MPRHATILARELQTIRSSFTRIARSFGRISPLLTLVSPPGAPMDAEAGRQPRKRPRLTGEQRKALKLQGKYMGTMRGLKPAQRSVIKKIRAEKGIRAAIEAAQRMTG
ncbi:MAG TPA: hypothetical protein VJV23_14940 [Candidatus Polarisedimenticolia bacterium]|nr:hypothetical protein [Candidatus Polarisedimenticolia bacterium]